MTMLLACAAAWAGAVDALPSVVGEPGQPPEDALLGDLDGDGTSELVVAVPSADLGGHEAGAIAFVSSPKTLAPLALLADEAVLVLTGEAPQDHAGTSMVVAGDLDGDGYADLAVGAPDATTSEAVVGGKVYVVYGGALPTGTGSLGDTEAANGIDRFEGGAAWSRVGERVFAGGDPNGDGTADLLVAAPVPTPDGRTGTGWLGLLAPVERGTGGVLALHFAPGETPTRGLSAGWVVAGTETLAGRSAAVIPDTNGDGRDELVLGAPGVGEGDDGVEATRGAAFVFLGPPSDALSPPQVEAPVFDEASAVATLVGREVGDAFPWSIQALGNATLFAVPEEDVGRGAVYVFAALDEGTTDGADRALHGAAQGDLFGRGVTDARGFADGAFLLVGAPGAAAGIGTAVLVSEPEGSASVGSVALGSIDGCWTDGELGHTVRGSTDDEGPALAMTAPFASVHGAADGLAAILDPAHEGALDATCAHGDATIPDADGDGTPASIDCDDDAAWRHPDALEVCGDDIDDDCDGEADEDCGPALADPGCSGCDTAPGSRVLVALLALALLRRRSVPLLVAPLAASAQELDALDGADHRLWGSAANESLHGPVVSFDGGLAVANFQGIQQAFAVGEVALLSGGLASDVLLAGAPVTLHGSSAHDYFGVAVATEAGALVVGIDHSGLTEDDAGEVALFRDPWDFGPTVSASRASVRLAGEHAGDSFGTVLDDATDLDGDGALDLVVGAPTFSYGRDVPERPEDCDAWTEPTLVSGAVYVIHGGLAALAVDGVAPIAVRERCAPDEIGDDSVATAVVQAPDPEERTFFGARVVTTDLDGDGYGDLLATSWGQDMAGTVSFFPGPIAIGDLALTPNDAEATLASGDPASYSGWSLAIAPDRAALAIGSQDDRLWIVDEAPSGQVDLGAATASGAPGSGFATSLAWGPALLVGAPFADETHVLDGTTFEPLRVLGGAPGLGSWVGWIDPADPSDLPSAVLVAPGATHNLEHQGVALVWDGGRLLDGASPSEGGCGCTHAPTARLSALFLTLVLLAIPGCRRHRPRCLRHPERPTAGTRRRARRTRLRPPRPRWPSPSP